VSGYTVHITCMSSFLWANKWTWRWRNEPRCISGYANAWCSM